MFAPGIGSAEIKEVEENLGSVELESTSGSQPGHALCLFGARALDRLATVREGETVRLVCQFSNVDGEQANRFPVFRSCWLQD